MAHALQFSGQFLMQVPETGSKVKPDEHFVHLGSEHDGQVSKQLI